MMMLKMALVTQALALDEWTMRTMRATSLEEVEALDAEYATFRSEELKYYAEQRKLQTGSSTGDSQPLLAQPKYGYPGFYHGVASGSPTTEAVVLWTRFTPWAEDDVVQLEFRIAKVDPSLDPIEAHLDPALNPELRRGIVAAEPEHDWVAKVDVHGLEAGAEYAFAFVVVGSDLASPVGQTKTSPASGTPTTRVAVASCSDFTYGYFHAYDIASRIEDLDLWIHMGDYVYEYGNWYDRASSERNAAVEPPWEMVSLQDYRLRFAVYHDDQGLRNLRRRAPMMATWDDHESTNNPYAWDGVEGTGAQNHQPTCPVDFTATDAEKRSATCDRDEGDWRVRVNDAARAYYEWMPLRSGAYFDGMGLIEDYDHTQIVQWGDLATLFGIDTRHTVRSREPTLDSSFHSEFNFVFGENFTDVNEYSIEGSAAYEEVMAATARAQAEKYDETMVLVSEEQFQLMEDEFSASKEAGTPWQIFLSSVMMTEHVGPDVRDASKLDEAAEYAESLDEFWETFLPSASGGAWRRILAARQTNTSWNRDGWAGFAVQRERFTELCKTSAANCVVLSGDVHDFWAATLFDKGTYEAGTPVATNLIAGGVTRTGWGPFVAPTFADAMGGDDMLSEAYDVVEAAFLDANPGLVYAGTKDPGFFVMEINATHMITEFVCANPHGPDADIDKPRVNLFTHDLARALSGDITMSSYCDVSLVTTAGQPGSLEKQADCQIPLEDARPELWDLPVPAALACETDVDCDDGMACAVPEIVACDAVFNCPSQADAARKKTLRKLRFGYSDGGGGAAADDGPTGENFGRSSGPLGACVPAN